MKLERFFFSALDATRYEVYVKCSIVAVLCISVRKARISLAILQEQLLQRNER